MIKRFNVCVKKIYTSQGAEKAYWPSVGELVYFPANGDKKEGYKLSLHMFPGLPLYVFENKPKEQSSSAPVGDQGSSDNSEVPY